jgi:hypothetical protein
MRSPRRCSQSESQRRSASSFSHSRRMPASSSSYTHWLLAKRRGRGISDGLGRRRLPSTTSGSSSCAGVVVVLATSAASGAATSGTSAASGTATSAWRGLRHGVRRCCCCWCLRRRSRSGGLLLGGGFGPWRCGDLRLQTSGSGSYWCWHRRSPCWSCRRLPSRGR